MYRVTGAELTVGGMEPKVPDVVAVDLSHVNEGMASKGCAPVDAILGANVFDAHAAVIDYGSSSLFLKV